MGFVLDLRTAGPWAVERGLVPAGTTIRSEELAGGVSASVIALRSATSEAGLVVKQALPRLRVRDEWLATQTRTETEAEAMQLCATLTPGAVPQVLALEPETHVMAMELVEGCVNWQAEVAEARVHAETGSWAGRTLGAWHAATLGRADVAERYGEIEAFEQLRLRPFHETVMRRRPELAPLIGPRVDALRRDRRCLVHGDYAMKNILVGPGGPWVLDFEVAHLGNPLFDLGFFLSFVVLSAIRWPECAAELRTVGDGFLTAYAAAAGEGFAGTDEDAVAHTACLILARTDGKSPAQFLDEPSRLTSREIGTLLLRDPAAGLWDWL